MKTEIFKLDPACPDIEAIKYCGEIIKNGGLVCFPTETVYGLGANAYNGKAVKKIFEAKGRPGDNPLIVHVDSYEMAEIAINAPDYQIERMKKLGEKYWPGPLTMIVDKDDSIPVEVSCGLTTVGIRMPKNPIALALIRESGVPIAAPSANLSGKPSPTCFRHCEEDLMGKVDAIIDGGQCGVGVESTVLDLTGDVPEILRPGAITLENVQEVLGNGQLCDWRIKELKGAPKSPGMKYKHYSPKADVFLYSGDVEKQRLAILNAAKLLEDSGVCVGIMTTDDGIDFYKNTGGKYVLLSMGDRNLPLTITKNIFYNLRRFDELGASVIFCEGIDEKGVGNAVMNRLYRAAGTKVVEV